MKLKKKKKSKKIKIGGIRLEKLEMFWDIIWMESSWIMFQAAKILHYFRYRNFSEFYFPNKINENNKSSKYIQRSNVFSYIIIRSAIFFRLDEFLRICRKYNTKNKNNPMKHNIPNSVMIKFLQKTFRNSKYQSTINNLIILLEEIGDKRNVKKNIYTSMRMTCVEHK